MEKRVGVTAEQFLMQKNKNTNLKNIKQGKEHEVQEQTKRSSTS